MQETITNSFNFSDTKYSSFAMIIILRTRSNIDEVITKPKCKQNSQVCNVIKFNIVISFNYSSPMIIIHT